MAAAVIAATGGAYTRRTAEKGEERQLFIRLLGPSALWGTCPERQQLQLRLLGEDTATPSPSVQVVPSKRQTQPSIDVVSSR